MVRYSQDGFLLVWGIGADLAVDLRASQDMKEQGWLYTWGGRYNQPDTLLLVAGVIDEVEGEVAILETVTYTVLWRVPNNPYDVMGAWCGVTSWLSGSMSLLEDETCSMLRLNSLVDTKVEDVAPDTDAWVETHVQSTVLQVRSQMEDGTNYLRCLTVTDRAALPQGASPLLGSYENFLRERSPTLRPQEVKPVHKSLLEGGEYCLVFLCSQATSVPHQIGFKRLYPQDVSAVPVISAPDHRIELAGHIVGVAVARDGRHLYANVRRWPANAQPVEDEPPPIAQEIELVVVDLATLAVTDTTYSGHKGYTDSKGAFYIYLDVSPRLVSSGSEDHRARVWDRDWGCCVASLPHDSCVNCVAFSPATPGILATVSDDHTVKVWKSRALNRRYPTPDSPMEEAGPLGFLAL